MPKKNRGLGKGLDALLRTDKPAEKQIVKSLPIDKVIPQKNSKVEITGIGEDTPKEKKAPAKADKDLAVNEVNSDTVDKKDGEKKKTPLLKSMRKQELIDFAKANNIDIDEKATNAVLIETIEAALK